MKIGLTGGMGCGKSTVLKFFAQSGADILDSDGIVRDLLTGCDSTIREISSAFGHEILNREGMIDRGKLAGIVFGNSEKIARLESILHPKVREVWTRFIADACSLVVVEIPLLFEKGLERHFDKTVCLACSQDLQLLRLRGRGFSDSQIHMRLQRQLSLNEKMQMADIILLNNGSIEHLGNQVKLLLDIWGLPTTT